MENIAVPIDVQAFALSPSCCEGLSRIAPITQPNYVGLRLDESLMQHDVLDHVDLHLTSPKEFNVRVTDLGTDSPQFRKNRLGVYLHWSLPRYYRAAKQNADSTQAAKDAAGKNVDVSQPVYSAVPTRWLIVRKLSTDPQSGAQPAGKLPTFQSWVIESDRLQHIDDIPDDVDLEVDVTPFVQYEGDAQKDGVLATQAEIFLGSRTKHSGWQDQPGGWREGLAPPGKTAQHLDRLTIMNSTNPLFPDYVPHNGSIFSLVDSFEYRESNDVQHLSSATADYYVIGWHTSTAPGPLSKADDGKLRDRLSKVFMSTEPAPDFDTDVSKNAELAKIKAILESKDATNVLLYGAVYNVKYNVEGKPTSKADEVASKLTKDAAHKDVEPFTIGTTPLDAVLTFLKAHETDIETFFPSSTTSGITNQTLADNILDLSAQLYTADDSYDSRVRAQDLLYANNWGSSQGGFDWKFDGKAKAGEPPAAPTPDQTKKLAALNEKQAQLDALSNKLQLRRWELFALWWNFVSDLSNYNNEDTTAYRNNVHGLADEIGTLQNKVAALTQQIGTQAGVLPLNAPVPAEVPCKKVPLPAFFTKKDPTVCIAGLDSGWPLDFLSVITVKLHRQLKDPTSVNGFGSIFGGLANPLPSAVRDTAERVLALLLDLSNKPTDKRVDEAGKSLYVKGLSDWANANPFHPLFIEWEAKYYHIPRDHWDLGLKKNPFGAATKQARFSLIDKPLYEDPEMQKDTRILSGRALIVPQPVFSLKNIVRSVLDNSPDVPKNVLANKDKIINSVENLRFLSSPLDGLTNHLLTKYTGSHVTPLVRQSGNKANEPLQVLQDAYRWQGDPLQLGEKGILRLIDSESATTPYGNLLPFDDPKHYPFKGVTHGQMIITKLNIIDKFGQAICLPSIRQTTPNPNVQTPEQLALPPDALYPCLSDYLTPEIDANGVLNTIYGEENTTGKKTPLCRFIQLTPSINQPARINSSFMTRNIDATSKTASPTTSYPFWHETDETIPETPVVGWIVINYADSGLQFFLRNGTFYREVRFGGPAGVSAAGKWLPFDAPPNKDSSNAQLDGLIQQLLNPAFLQAFIDSINKAIVTMPYAPSDYSAYANALVGKPLALVNVGWWLELSSPAYKPQNTLGMLPADPDAELASYKFPVKIGDYERPFDGIVGYFNTDNVKDGSTDWTEFYTYFPSSKTDASIEIVPQNFPEMQPRYIDPVPTNNGIFNVIGDSRDQTFHPLPYKSYIEARTAQYQITTCLIDPYAALHAYSPILPIKSLQLPAWTIQKAFAQMTAFFRLGPYCSTQDVPTTYDEARPLNPDTWYKTQTAQNQASSDLPPPATATPAGTTPAGPVVPATGGTTQPAPLPSQVVTSTPSIRLPISGKKGLWQWLQPYDVPSKDQHGNVIAGQRETKFNALGVDQEDTKIRRDPGPYTFVEGYLQLARPLLSEDVKGL